MQLTVVDDLTNYQESWLIQLVCGWRKALTTFLSTLKANLKREGLAMQLFGPLLLAKALPMAYRSDEVEAIVGRTSFAGGCRIENVALVGLPIWMHIQLTKGESL